MELPGISSTDPRAGISGAATSEELGKDAFMQLLVAQLRNQDPMNPQTNEDFIAQLAQFSSLEQMKNLNDSFLGMAALQQSNALMSQLTEGSQLIGQNVSYEDPLTGDVKNGTVDTVRIQGGIAVLNVEGQDVPLMSVLEITGPSSDDSGGDDSDSGSDDGGSDDN